jgi:hypothetical protein
MSSWTGKNWGFWPIVDVQILQQQSDSAGNIGWVILNTSQTWETSAQALAYLNTLPQPNPPGQNYIAQIIYGNNSYATILAQV